MLPTTHFSKKGEVVVNRQRLSHTLITHGDVMASFTCGQNYDHQKMKVEGQCRENEALKQLLVKCIADKTAIFVS